jgi:midasin
MVTLHLDHATDSKSLLGAYVCGDVPGEFRWQPGALAQAVSQGRWVLLEDVDAAPSEVMSALAPLMEGRPLPVPGRGEAITPAPGFALFGSVTHRPGLRELACPGLWTRVHLAPPPQDEMADILSGLLVHPGGKQLVQPLLSSLTATRAMCGQSVSAVGGPIVNLSGRDLTLRDAIKWGHRMCYLHAGSMQSHDGALSVAARELAVLEGADVLAGMLPAGPARDAILCALADAWTVPRDRALHYDTLHRPSMASADGQLHVGRVTLALHNHSASVPPPSANGYALTSHACRQLERLAAAVGCCEPVLLVGETGAGKTAAIQALARSLGARLTVVNMSTQSDSADLLGGFKPQDPSALCLPLAAHFGDLFGQTFPKEANAEFAARVVRPTTPPPCAQARARSSPHHHDECLRRHHARPLVFH